MMSPHHYGPPKSDSRSSSAPTEQGDYRSQRYTLPTRHDSSNHPEYGSFNPSALPASTNYGSEDEGIKSSLASQIAYGSFMTHSSHQPSTLVRDAWERSLGVYEASAGGSVPNSHSLSELSMSDQRYPTHSVPYAQLAPVQTPSHHDCSVTGRQSSSSTEEAWKQLSPSERHLREQKMYHELLQISQSSHEREQKARKDRILANIRLNSLFDESLRRDELEYDAVAGWVTTQPYPHIQSITPAMEAEEEDGQFRARSGPADMLCHTFNIPHGQYGSQLQIVVRSRTTPQMTLGGQMLMPEEQSEQMSPDDPSSIGDDVSSHRSGDNEGGSVSQRIEPRRILRHLPNIGRRRQTASVHPSRDS